MITKIEKFLLDNELATMQRIIVGFSGGFDSMCLLDVLNKLSDKFGFQLIAVHLNHNWRGEESAIEAENCKNFCNKFNIKFYTETLDANEKHTETRARELRYQFFEKVLDKFDSDALLTAHTKSDIAETIIYRIIKGTGIKGLQGISPKINKIYRPMLDISRSEIEEYCKINHLVPNDDSSNKNNYYSRNFIRNEILKLFERINPKVEDALNSLSVLAFEEEQIVKEYINSLNLYRNGLILTEKFKYLSNYVQKRIVYELFVNYDIEYTQKRILDALTFIKENINSKSGKKYSLDNDKWLFVSNEFIDVISHEKSVLEVLTINSTGKYVFENYEFNIQKCNKLPEKFPDDKELKAYVEIKEPFEFELRTRRNGDVIVPLGSKGTMKLKKYFISKNVPQHKKGGIILLCKGNEVLWVSGLGLSNKLKVVNNCTHVLSLKKKE